jgi:hypothetical protein
MTGYFALLFPTYSKIIDMNSLLAKMGPMAKLLGAQRRGRQHSDRLPPHRALLDDPAGGHGRLCGRHGQRLHGGEESRGTIDVLLSYPVSRSRLVLEKTLALVIACVVTAVTTGVFALVGAALSASDLPVASLAAALALVVLLGLAFGAIALAISAATGNRAASIGILAA